MSVVASLRSLVVNLLLAVVSILITVLLAEIGVRLYHGKLFSAETTRASDFQVTGGPRAVYDANLGWLPKQGIRVAEFTSTIGPHGIRLHGDPANLDPTPDILAVGDSFTFGDEVDDHETWPAHLQRITGMSVLNGGVFGYGVDQTVLRAESLLESYRPRILIVSMIADDLKRSELAYRYGWKPYYDIVDGALELRNVPVPERASPVRYPALRDALGYSYLANGLLRRLAPNWWHNQGIEKRAHDQGTEVAELLMARLAKLVDGRNIRVIVLGQADRSLDVDSLKPVLESAEQNGLAALDLTTALAERLENDPSLESATFLGGFAGHMTSAGNEWVAQNIAQYLAGLDAAPAASERLTED